MSGALVKNDEKALFINKKRHWLRRHNGKGSKGDVDKSQGHQQEGSIRQGEHKKITAMVANTSQRKSLNGVATITEPKAT